MSRRADPRVDRQDGSARAKGYARSAAVASNAVRRLTEPLWGPTYRTFWNDGAWMGRRQCSGFTGTQYTFFFGSSTPFFSEVFIRGRRKQWPAA